MTHINAYFAEVELKRAALQAAQSELAEAERQLEEQKVLQGYDEYQDVVEAEIVSEGTKGRQKK